MKLPPLTPPIKIALWCLGGALVIWLILTISVASSSTRTERAVIAKNDGRPRCPECGREIPSAGADCPFCQLNVEGTKGKGKSGGIRARNWRVPATLLGTFLTMLAVYLGLLYRRRRLTIKEEALFHMHCRKCSRKIRYRESQIGRPALCPICRSPILFPKPAGLKPRWGERIRLWLGLGPKRKPMPGKTA
jgi:hypothetical protein